VSTRLKVKPKRVLLLAHEDLLPPESIEGLSEKEIAPFSTEWDVFSTLKEMGHDVHTVGVHDELAPLRRAIEYLKPDVVFNLLEEFHDKAIFDTHVVGYLELLKVPYTGCNPRGLLIARDKALSKKVLGYHRIRTPKFFVSQRKHKVRKPKALEYPLIVKTLVLEGSEGIAQASVVHDDKELVERVKFVHEKLLVDAIVEQYIDGRELYSAVLGNGKLIVLPTWEIVLDKLPDDSYRIATRKVKWDLDYQEKHGIELAMARDLPVSVERELPRLSRRICRTLGIDGYCRIDFRLSKDGQLYFLEANPNPDIADYEEFASAAKAAGLSYEELLDRILQMAIKRATP
jgi:D-alanine-D-alanine ligase